MTVEELEAKLEIVTKHRDALKKMLDETNRHVLDLAALVEPGLHRHPVTVLQATHAFILNLMNERDEAKKEAAESSKEMIMLFNDHSSIELEKQLRIEELTRERDKFQALAELGDGYRRERDEARAEVERLRGMTPELPPRPFDGTGMPRYGFRWNGPTDPLAVPMSDGYWTPWHLASAEVQRLTDERDKARTRLAMMTDWHENMCRSSERGWAQEAERTRERDEARADVERLTDARDELIVRVVDQGAELRATRDAYGTAYSRGAEAMRSACAATIHDGGLVWTRESAERALREIGILEEP